MSSQRSTPSLDELFRTLADGRRRRVLYCLRRSEDTVLDVDDVVEQLIEWHDHQPEQRDAVRRELESSLHHVHLPKLSAANLVDYDWRTRTIRYWEHNHVEAHLTLCERRELRDDR